MRSAGGIFGLVGKTDRREGDRTHERIAAPGLWRRIVACGLALVATSPAWPADPDLPAFARYQVDLGKVPANAEEAAAGIGERSRRVIEWNACGREIEFFAGDGQRDNGEDGAPGKPSADIYSPLIAKIAWLPRVHGPTPMFVEPADCKARVRYFALPDVRDWLNLPRPPGPPFFGSNHIDREILNWPPDAGLDDQNSPTTLWNAAFARRWGAQCDGILKSVTPEPGINGVKSYVLEFAVGRRCMIEQINRALVTRQKNGNPGTTGLPCSFVDKAGHGDWDMTVIALLRAVYLDRNLGTAAIAPATNVYVFNHLLTISGSLEPPTYGLHECGNTENDTGPPGERSDEDDFYDDDFFRGLGDIFDWLLKWLVVVVAAAVAVGVAAAWVGQAIVAAIGTPVVWALLAGTQVRVPETENHLLMINTSRYLTNQLQIRALQDEDDRQDVLDQQVSIREWLLQRLQTISKDDFMEYNAKPYQRLSVAAVLNLHDFAEDDELRRASQIVLEFASAKFAAGSNQGRRIVPFRRLMETNAAEIYGPNAEAMRPRRVTDFGGGSDHQIAAMMLFAGQMQQLPDADPALSAGDPPPPGARRVASAITGEMIWEATSAYRPHDIVLDLAIDKTTPYDQRVHHDGVEIYSSGASFLVTAGGITTPRALGMAFTPLQLDVTPPFDAFLKNADRGAGVPTTLMPAAGRGNLQRTDFIRIEGYFSEFDHEDRDTAIPNQQCETDRDASGPKCRRNLTNDHNLCVRKGFACGINLVVPRALRDAGCVRKLATAPPAWSFIDSTACPPWQGGPPFYVVLFERPCPAGHDSCKGVWGFFEAVDRTGTVPAFETFMTRTVAANPLALLPTSDAMVGEYRSWAGERIQYSATGHAGGGDRTGITGVNDLHEPGYDDWPLAAGPIAADGEGRITIRAPGRRPAPGKAMRLELDFTDWEQPTYGAVP